MVLATLLSVFCVLLSCPLKSFCTFPSQPEQISTRWSSELSILTFFTLFRLTGTSVQNIVSLEFQWSGLKLLWLSENFQVHIVCCNLLLKSERPSQINFRWMIWKMWTSHSSKYLIYFILCWGLVCFLSFQESKMFLAYSVQFWQNIRSYSTPPATSGLERHAVPWKPSCFLLNTGEYVFDMAGWDRISCDFPLTAVVTFLACDLTDH